MNRKDALSRLTSRLIARRDALRKTLAGDLEVFRNITAASGVGDNVDAAIDSANDDVLTELVEIESRELAQVAHALERIYQGAVGRCEFCGCKIPESRLSALPYTTSCIACQRTNETRAFPGGTRPDPARWAKLYENPMGPGESEERGGGDVDFGGLELGYSPLSDLCF
jgi:DnaK suppressor protein